VKLSDEQIAWIIHEAHRAFQMTTPLYPEHVMPAPPWVTMTQWQQETVIGLVRIVRRERVRRPQFPDHILAAVAHEEWVKRMRGKGWTYGEDKDPQQKTHPCIVEWVDLPDYDQAKTLQAVAIAKVHI
jgi:RyR domain